ncbi:hypothetical protein [Roseivirga pacifica]|uniref:hypothetical protein n=1 Tax=Roseivirga pacifica TaxID=1267423 RepID=UPI003BB01032
MMDIKSKNKVSSQSIGATNRTKRYVNAVLVLLLLVTSIIACDDSDYDSDAASPALPLTIADTSVRAAGYGQYRLKTLSGTELNIAVDLSALPSVSSLAVTKTINTEVDESFGTNGVMELPISNGADTYTYDYTALVEDVDQLIGLSFTASDGSNEVTSDLTLIVTVSPRDNIPTKKWAWTGKIWVDGGNAPDLKDCEKDNFFFFNADSTVTVDYGANTAAGDCAFDGFTVYDKWYLTEDEQFFVIESHGLFDPTPVVEQYRVEKFDTDVIQMSIDIDLSVFGLSTEETFLYEYTARQK